MQTVNFTEGQEVKKGDTLAVIDPRPLQAALDQAKAKKAQDQAQLISAQKDLARFTELRRRASPRQQSLDQQQAKVDQLKATIDADQAAIDSARDAALPTPPSPRRSTAASASARSMPATSCTPSDHNPLTVLTADQAVDVDLHPAAEDSGAVREAMLRGAVVGGRLRPGQYASLRAATSC